MSQTGNEYKFVSFIAKDLIADPTPMETVFNDLWLAGYRFVSGTNNVVIDVNDDENLVYVWFKPVPVTP